MHLFTRFLSVASIGVAAPSLLALTFASAGCSGSSSPPNAQNQEPVGDAGGADTGAKIAPVTPDASASQTGNPGAGDAASGDAAPNDAPDSSTAAFASNTPGATVVDVGSPATPGLALLSSNFTQAASGTQVYQQWLGEVQNVGAGTVCQVSLDLTYMAGSSAIATPSTTYLDADPYKMSGGSLTFPCIAPGEIGSFYSNGFAASMADLTSITSIHVSFHPSTYPGVAPAPDAPTITAAPATIVGENGISGTLVGVGSAINNISLHAYPRDATGLVLGQLVATDLGELDPGASYTFSTAPITPVFGAFRIFASYIEGASTAAVVTHVGGDEASIEAARRASEREVAQRETAARAAEARGAR